MEESLEGDSLSEIWDQIALTAGESRVVESIRILEPGLERIAFLSGRQSGRGGSIVMKIKGIPERIPLGSFGDGVRRLLALSFALAKAENGVLLIDEIGPLGFGQKSNF